VALGPHDGVLSPSHAAQAAAAVLAGPISPSALEKYLSCPFAFYLRYVLGLEVPDDPDESLSIEPVDLGSLAHEILQGAYAAALSGDFSAAGVLAAIPDTTDAKPSAAGVLAALDGVAAAAFARAEARGLTGFPLSWRVLADGLLADLRHVVETDPCWHDGLVPAQFEWWFGGDATGGAAGNAAGNAAGDATGDGGAPPPELQVGDRVLRFHGRIDRIDRSADGRAVRLVDYKTGKGANEAGRVRQGLDVQLPVYVLALLAGGEAPEQIVAEYRLVRRRSGFKTLPLSGDTGTIREQLAATLEVALAGIEGGLFPRWPARECEYCDAADSCGADRIAFAVTRRDPRLRALLDFKEPARSGRGGAS
jgi:ATP-dependent helicase/nuclease subunit B